MSGLRWALGFDIFNSIFVQLTYMGSVFVLFLSELGMNKTSIGFMLALLPFAGLVSLGVAPRVARIGFKRAFMIFWTGRTIVTLPLLATLQFRKTARRYPNHPFDLFGGSINSDDSFAPLAAGIYPARDPR